MPSNKCIKRRGRAIHRNISECSSPGLDITKYFSWSTHVKRTRCTQSCIHPTFSPQDLLNSEKTLIPYALLIYCPNQSYDRLAACKRQRYWCCRNRRIHPLHARIHGRNQQDEPQINAGPCSCTVLLHLAKLTLTFSSSSIPLISRRSTLMLASAATFSSAHSRTR